MREKSHVNLDANQSLKIFTAITPPEIILQYFIDNPQEKVLKIGQEFVSKGICYVSPFSVIRFGDRLSFIQDQDITVLKAAGNKEFINSINAWRDTRFQGALLFIQCLETKKWTAVLRVDSRQKSIAINLLESDEIHKYIIDYLNHIPENAIKYFYKNPLAQFLLDISQVLQYNLFASEYKMFTQYFLGKGSYGEVIRVYKSYDCDFNNRSMKLVNTPRAVKIQTKESDKYDKRKQLKTLIEHYALLAANPGSESAGWCDKSFSFYSVERKNSFELYRTYIEMEDYTGGIANTGIPLNKLKIKNPAHAIQVILWISQALVKGLHRGNNPYGIVHRDLKQEQIIVSPQDKCVYIVDFGTAYSVTDNIKSISGSDCYFAPEVFKKKTSVATDYFCFAIIALELIAQSTGLNRHVVVQSRKNCMKKKDNLALVAKTQLDVDNAFRKINLPVEMHLQLYNFLEKMSSPIASKRPTTGQALEFFDQQKINYYAFHFSGLVSECMFSSDPLNFDEILKDILDLKNTLFLEKKDIKRINFKMREIDPVLFKGCFSEAKNSIEKFLENCFFSNLDKNEFKDQLTNLSKVLKKDYLFFNKIDELLSMDSSNEKSLKENKKGTDHNFSIFCQSEPLKNSVNTSQKFHGSLGFSGSGKN